MVERGERVGLEVSVEMYTPLKTRRVPLERRGETWWYKAIGNEARAANDEVDVLNAYASLYAVLEPSLLTPPVM